MGRGSFREAGRGESKTKGSKYAWVYTTTLQATPTHHSRLCLCFQTELDFRVVCNVSKKNYQTTSIHSNQSIKGVQIRTIRDDKEQ